MAIDIADIERQARRSVRQFPDPTWAGGHFIISLAAYADGFVDWGANQVARDQQLRAFYPKEHLLASVVDSLAARNAAFSWTLEGPPRTVARLQDVLHASDYGRGWVSLVIKASVDLYTQDNGCFIEVIRDGGSANAPLLGLGHLDAGRCTRTGNPEIPVLYTDTQGQVHKLQWWQVIMLADAPSPIETMNGVGMCAVSRVLLRAQEARDILVYKRERVAGRNPGALHVVSGVRTKELEDTLAAAAQNADDKGLLRYQLPAVLGTLDPTAEVKIATIALRDLPNGFNQEETERWYVNALAQAFQVDYQDIAPLPGGGLGTSAQSQILHMKSRGKGPELVRKLVEHHLNFFVLPANVTFKFTEQDFEALGTEANVRKAQAEAYKLYADIGMPTNVIWQMMQDEGILKPEYLEVMQQQDVTPERTATDEEQMATEEEMAVSGAALAPQPVRPPTPPGGQPVTLKAKQARGADYWERQRARLEREYEEEMRTVLDAVRRKVNERLRAEVALGG